MTYPEALERLKGHRDWWYYEYHGRTDEKVRQAAIDLASLPDISEHLSQAARAASPVAAGCGSC
jgi:hypothetical protein